MYKITTLLLCLAAGWIPAYAQNTALNADVFYNFTYDPEDSILNAFEYQRAYFTFRKNLAPGIDYTFITDIDPNSEPRTVYLKNAKLDWNTDFGRITIGLQGLNMFPVQEKNWGYRSLEKSAMDRYGYSSSADLGLGYASDISHSLHFSVLVTNGTGYKKHENDEYKKLSLQLVRGETCLDKQAGINLGLVYSIEPYATGVDSVYNQTVTGFFAGLATGTFRTGFEIDRSDPGNADQDSWVLSLYGNLRLHSRLDFLVRFDRYMLGKEYENYLISGMALAPAPGLKIMPNLRLLENNVTKRSLSYHLNFEFAL